MGKRLCALEKGTKRRQAAIDALKHPDAPPENDRDAKIAEIAELEQELKHLLEGKARFLARPQTE
jgi:hypothetical protein